MMKSINFAEPTKQLKPDISDMPQLDFRPESLRDSFISAIPDIVIMVLMVILFFVGAFVSFLRYDVR
jgi:ABC-type transport system involved in multi-copper enzyme maturation permease subunit